VCPVCRPDGQDGVVRPRFGHAGDGRTSSETRSGIGPLALGFSDRGPLFTRRSGRSRCRRSPSTAQAIGPDGADARHGSRRGRVAPIGARKPPCLIHLLALRSARDGPLETSSDPQNENVLNAASGSWRIWPRGAHSLDRECAGGRCMVRFEEHGACMW